MWDLHVAVRSNRLEYISIVVYSHAPNTPAPDMSVQRMILILHIL